MKAILLSIRPKWLAKILNGEKTIEIRKKFPQDYVGWVYIYCTKEDSLGRIKELPKDRYFVDCVETPQDFAKMDSGYDGKGKVVARFWCDKVEEITIGEDRRGSLFFSCHYGYHTESLRPNLLMGQSCLDLTELIYYLGKKNGFAIYLTNEREESTLEIFDKPRELRDFKKCGFYENCIKSQSGNYYSTKECADYYAIRKAPQNFCYVEVE